MPPLWDASERFAVLCLSDIAMGTSERPAGLFLGDMLPWLPRNAPCCASETLCCGCLRAPCFVFLMDTPPWPPQGAPTMAASEHPAVFPLRGTWPSCSSATCCHCQLRAPGHVPCQRHPAMAASEQTTMLCLGHFTMAASEHPTLFPS